MAIRTNTKTSTSVSTDVDAAVRNDAPTRVEGPAAGGFDVDQASQETTETVRPKDFANSWSFGDSGTQQAREERNETPDIGSFGKTDNEQAPAKSAQSISVPDVKVSRTQEPAQQEPDMLAPEVKPTEQTASAAETVDDDQSSNDIDQPELLQAEEPQAQTEAVTTQTAPVSQRPVEQQAESREEPINPNEVTGQPETSAEKKLTRAQRFKAASKRISEAANQIEATVAPDIQPTATQSAALANRLKNEKTGTVGAALSGQLSGDPTLEFGDVSVGDVLLAHSYTIEGSPIQTIVNDLINKTDTWVDEEKMVNDADYRIDTIRELFNAYPQKFIVTKHPVPNDLSSVSMRVLVHQGTDIHTNPVISPLFNQDFDGDMSNVAFNLAPMTAGRSRSIGDYILDHFGELVLEPSLFATFKWGDDKRQIELMTETLRQFDLSKDSVREISDAWTKLCTAESGKQDAAFKSFIKKVNSIAAKSSGREGNMAYTRGELFTGILRQVQTTSRNVLDYYVANNADRVADDRIWTSLGYNKDAYQSPVVMDEYVVDGEVYNFSSLVTEGSLPKDFDDLMKALRIDWKKTKKEDGKTVNIYFRIPASIAKQVRRGDSVIVGSDSGTITDNTMYGLLTSVMSSSACDDDALLKSSTEARRTIVQQTGMPKDYADLGSFFERFVRVNNLIALEYNAGSVIVDQNFGIRQQKNATIAVIRDLIKYEDVRKAFVDCYRDFTLNTLFGNASQNSVFLKFWGEVRLKDWMRSDMMNEIENHNRPGKIAPGNRDYETQVTDFLRSVLAQRSSSWGTFQKELNELLESIVDRKKELDAWSGFSDVMFDVVSTLGGDVAMRRGYMSSKAFRSSDLYKNIVKLQGNKKTQAQGLKSLLFTELTEDMFFDVNKRYNEILDIHERMKTAKVEELTGLSTRYENLFGRLMDALSDVKSQNILWSNVSRDWFEAKFERTDGRWVPRSKPRKSAADGILVNNTVSPDKKMLAVKDLFNRYYAQGVSCPFVTADKNGNWNPKRFAGVDLVVDGKPLGNMHNTYILEQMMFEKMNQEHAGNNSAFKSNKALENVRATGRKLGSLRLSSREQMAKNVNATLGRLIRENGEEAVNQMIERQMSNDMAATIDIQNFEAVLDFDLSYGLSEKAKTAPVLSSMFKQVCMAKNGRAISDANRAMDLAMKQMALEEFSQNVPVIRYLLAHPDESMTVYDPRSNEKVEVNKETLLNGMSNIEFLRAYPNVALNFRNHVVNVWASSDSATSASIGASDNLYNSLRHSDMSSDFTLFADMPSFYALATCFKKSGGWQSQYDSTLRTIQSCDVAVKSGKTIRDWIDETFPKPTTEGERDILGLIERDMPSMLRQFEKVKMRPVKNGWSLADLFEYTPNYMHMNSVLSTAKTEDSTAVNGNTTAKINAPLIWLAAYNAPACDAEPTEVSAAEFFSDDSSNKNCWKNLVGVVTESGWIIDEGTLDRIRKESGETVRIYNPKDCASEGVPCCHHSVADRSTNTRVSEQSTALGRFLQVFRDKGTEALNLKIAKTGDDGKNSISKLSIFNKDGWDAVADGVRQLAKLDLPNAREELANWLKEVCGNLGYDMIPDLDFVNVAQIMIRRLPNGEFDVLSIEQISHYQRNILYNYHDMMMDAATPREIGEACNEALKQFPGYKPMSIDKVLNSINPKKLMYSDFNAETGDATSTRRAVAETGVNQTLRPWMSSAERNRAGLRSAITQFLGKTGDQSVYMVSDSTREQEAKSLKKRTKADLPSFAKGYILNVYEDKSGKTDQIEHLGIGPKNLYFIESDGPLMREAEARRATVYSKSLDVFENYACKPIAVEDGYIVNFLDQDVNERTSTEVNIGTHMYTDDQLTYVVYDSLNEHSLGDAEMQFYRSLIDNTRVEESGTLELDIEDLFKNAFSDIQRFQTAEIDFMSAEEVVDKLINSDEKLTFDSDERTIKMVDQYVNKFIEGHDDNGFLIGQKVAIGDVIGIVKATFGDQTVYAPVTAFDLVGGKSGPAMMSITGVRFLPDTNRFAVDWNVNEGLLDDNGNVVSIKAFEGIEAAMKCIGRTKLPENGDVRFFEDGTPIGAAIAEFSIKSRLTSAQRMKMKMNTLTTMMQSKSHGYNIADLDTTFPNSPELKQAILEGNVSIEEWKQLLREPIQILPLGSDALANAKLNKILRNYVDSGINPLIFCGSYFMVDGQRVRHHVMPPRWSDLYDPDSDTTDALMRMFHLVDPTICPDGLDGDPQGCLFNNQLQLYVPYYGLAEDMETRVEAGQWADVSVSQLFFDSEKNDILRRPSVKSNSASILADVSRSMMKQPIQKSRLSTLIDYSLTRFDLGFPSERDATAADVDPQAQTPAQVLSDIEAKLFPDGIDDFLSGLKDNEPATISEALRDKVDTDYELNRLIAEVSSIDAFDFGNPVVNASLASIWKDYQ